MPSTEPGMMYGNMVSTSSTEVSALRLRDAEIRDQYTAYDYDHDGDQAEEVAVGNGAGVALGKDVAVVIERKLAGEERAR